MHRNLLLHFPLSHNSRSRDTWYSLLSCKANLIMPIVASPFHITAFRTSLLSHPASLNSLSSRRLRAPFHLLHLQQSPDITSKHSQWLNETMAWTDFNSKLSTQTAAKAESIIAAWRCCKSRPTVERNSPNQLSEQCYIQPVFRLVLSTLLTTCPIPLSTASFRNSICELCLWTGKPDFRKVSK